MVCPWIREAKPINSRASHVESRNYSLSTYGRFEDGSDALQYILGSVNRI